MGKTKKGRKGTNCDNSEEKTDEARDIKKTKRSDLENGPKLVKTHPKCKEESHNDDERVHKSIPSAKGKSSESKTSLNNSSRERERQQKPNSMEHVQAESPLKSQNEDKEKKVPPLKKKVGKKSIEENNNNKREKKKRPGKKTILAMQEALKKIKNEREEFQRKEEQLIKREEEAEKARFEALKLDQERKTKKKLKEKERRERLKAEGKLLTPKQKLNRAKAQVLLNNSLRIQQSAELPDPPAQRPKLGTRKRAPKPSKPENQMHQELIILSQQDEKLECEERVKDSWDDSPTEESDEEPIGQQITVDPAPMKEESIIAAPLNKLRAAIVCVLGHVDTGKTKILDKLRRTNVQDGEAGGITQQIGATNVPIEAVKEQIKFVTGASEMDILIPGLLIIDTPGHESFGNLRNRGSSLCDIAVLVVDIMHGLEQQTIESINLLKSQKTPFVVALNKIDRLYGWKTKDCKDVRDVIKAQASHTQREFKRRCKDVIVQFAEQSLNAALFSENRDFRSYVSLVPTSAITGEGIGNLLALIVELCQTNLSKRLLCSNEFQATVLEVKVIPGLGTTIDVILVNGTLKEGDTMLCAGTDGPIVTQIRSLLTPQPLRELRVKNAYTEHKKIQAVHAVKITARDLEKAIAGVNLFIAHKHDEIELLKAEVTNVLRSALSRIKLQERGVYVQASTLGSLEALLEFLRCSNIPYSGVRIGPVFKKDVIKASIMFEHEPQYAAILAFDVKIERDAQELADESGVKIFQADVIYHLFNKFMTHHEEHTRKKREEFKHVAVFPCKLRILPHSIYKSRDPIVCGVAVEGGIVKKGTPICVPAKDFVEVGVVTSIQDNHKSLDSARKGQEVCIKIEPLPGEPPKMIGRHFDHTDILVSKISRQSIDACKDYFRGDLLKSDWQVMLDLKKLFHIV